MPEISVIIPIYNAQSFLTKSINSILHQTFTDFELILVNDGSTDLSLIFCNSFAKTDSRVRVLDLPHDGVTAARIAAIHAAKGKYICFTDSDDWVEKEYLEHLYTAITENHTDAAMCHATLEFADRTARMNIPLKNKIYRGEEWEKAKHSVFLCTDDGKSICALSPFWDKIFKKETLQSNLKYFDKAFTFAGDTVLTTACLLDCGSLCVIENADYHYLRREKSILHSKHESTAEKLLTLKQVLQRICVEKGYPDLIKKADTVAAKMAERMLERVCDENGFCELNINL